MEGCNDNRKRGHNGHYDGPEYGPSSGCYRDQYHEAEDSQGEEVYEAHCYYHHRTDDGENHEGQHGHDIDRDEGHNVNDDNDEYDRHNDDGEYDGQHYDDEYDGQDYDDDDDYDDYD